MASKLSFLNSLTHERKKPHHNKDGPNNEDQLAIVKAAAWAWYQHGSPNEVKATSEFDATMSTHREPKPSRYKLEAMRSSMEKETIEGSSPIHQNKESLLDAYEVHSISRHLDRLLESNNNHNKLNASVDVGDRRTKKKKKKTRKGFFLRHSAICGREEDVVDPTSSASRDHRHQSTKSVPSVNLVKCLPTANNNGGKVASATPQIGTPNAMSRVRTREPDVQPDKVGNTLPVVSSFTDF